MSYETYPELMERRENVIYLQVPVRKLRKTTTQIRIEGANVMNPAIVANIVTIKKGRDYVSKPLRRTASQYLGLENRKGKMTILLDADKHASANFHGGIIQ